MKKSLISLIMVLTMIFIVAANAAALPQPFDAGAMGSERFRIPSIYTLNDGSILATADARYDHGKDSPARINTLSALLNGESFDYQFVNVAEDYLITGDNLNCASFIDSAVVQSGSGKVLMITTAYPTGVGILNAKKGSGMKNGRLLLTDKPGSSNIKDYNFAVGDFSGGFAPIDGTDYMVDELYNLYTKSGERIYSADGIQASVFYFSSPLAVFPTSYLVLRTSDDGGKTWGGMTMLNYLKEESESFMGTCPGRGLSIEYDGNNRILFCVYNHNNITEKASTIYSDDDGLTWHRGKSFKNSLLSQKSSESQLIACPDGSIRVFCRNGSRFITTGVSANGGKSFSKLKADTVLYGRKNCMVSFINTSVAIDGKQVVLGSFPSSAEKRADGVIVTGLMSADGSIDWIKRYHVNKGTFAYSCLTELPGGGIACLYEDEDSHIILEEFSLSADGSISRIDGDDIEYAETQSFSLKLSIILTKLFGWI